MSKYVGRQAEPVDACAKCEKMHLTGFGKPACKAHRTTRDPLGQLIPCKQAPARGLDVCKTHGGSTKRAKALSQKAREEHDRRTAADNVLRIFGRPRQIDPAIGLIEEYWRSAGIIAQLEQVVGAMAPEDLVWGKDREDVKTTAGDSLELTFKPDPETGVPQASEIAAAPTIEVKTTHAARPSIWLKMFNEERDRFIKLGIEIVRLELDARRDEYVRAQVDVFASVLLDPAMGLTPEQRVIAAAKLRALDGKQRADAIRATATIDGRDA